ncbi:MAG TPA: DsrE family protein, partial [Salinivirgaceae bacterium]|nr:DsrE family protein [Salinivirgaceae bacterium]
VILQEGKLPAFIVCYNEGVKLMCTGSPTLEMLKSLESKGVKIIACTTCLKHYGLMDSLEVGIAATMMDIFHLQNAADKVINL